MKKSSHTFYFLFLLILFSSFLMTFSSLAQTQNSAEVIQRYERGEITRPTAEEKSILRSYLNEQMQQVSPIQRSPISDAPLATFISENFATGSVTTPPAGWTQNRIAGDPTFDFWHFDNPGARTLNAPITTPAAIFDSDNYSFGGGPENVALESPVFSVPAAATVFIEWDQYFQGGFGGEANVEVFNGTSWINVYTTTLSTPNPDFQSINISTHVAGIANAQVRFRWVGDYSWYWIVDNVKVYSVSTGLSGIKTIPGDFATIKAAVDSLNQVGVGNGGVTFNVAAGHTEPITEPIVVTATGAPFDQIIFQKSGAGVNPKISRTDAGTLATSTLGGAGDAIIRLEGTDYITFDGIDVAATDQGIEYGYLTHKPSGTDGCQFVTITNCVITLTKGTSAYVAGIYVGNGTTSTSSAVGVTVTAASGINSNITITGNTVQNVHAGILVRGSSATGFYDSDVVIGQSGAGNVIQNFGGGSTTTTYGVYFIYVNNPSVEYNTINNEGGGGTPHGSILYGVFYSTVSGNVSGSSNSFTLANTSASSATYFMYNSSSVTSNTFNNNTFAAGTLSSTGAIYLIYASSTTPNVTVSGNQTSGTINRTGASGSFYCYYNLGSPTLAGTETLTNNNFSNISVSGSSALYGLYSNLAVAMNRISYGNTLSNWTGGTGSLYALYQLSTTSNMVYDNNIHDITTGGTVYALYFSGTNPTVYNNNVYNITTSGATFYGIYDAGTGTTHCYKNQVYNLTGNNASQTLRGIYITTGTSNNVYNNFVSDLNAPSSASLTGLVGIYVSGGTSIGLYYNTIYLNATSAGANFTVSGIYASTTPTVELRNNVVVNTSIPNGTGYRIAYQRSSTTLTSYAAASNNNDFYAGTPGSSNLIFYDGTNAIQTIGEYKTFVSPRDASSLTESPPFINSSTPPYNLHINPAIATQLESGGTPVTSPIAIIDDFDGDARNLTTPDIGADEFSGIALDLTPPIISYTPLLNTASTSSRTLVADISDPGSGVPTAGIGLPVLYWKKNYNGTWTGATSLYLSGSDYQFSFGGGVVAGDTVYYYIVAQDNATPPNVGAFPSNGAGGFTYNPPAASTPPINPSSYFIVGLLPLAGDYTVGLLAFNSITGKNIYFEKSVRKVMREVMVESDAPQITREKGVEYEEAIELSHTANGTRQMVEVEEITWIPMENGRVYEGDLFVKKVNEPSLDYPPGLDGVYATITAAVADLNLRGVSAPVNFLLTDATYPSETFPINIDVTNEALPTSTNRVTIKPNTSVTAAISGAAASSQIFNIMTSYITIDGSNSGGTSRNLTIENTTTTTPRTIVIGSKGTTPITGVTVKNCTIINGATTSSAVVVSDAAVPGTAGWFNNITIQNNSIQKAYIGNYNIAMVSPGNGSGLLIADNDFNSLAPNNISLVGVYVQGIDGVTVTNNKIGNYTTTYTANVTGIWFATGTTNSTISNNTIGPINITTAAPRGIVITSAVSNANVTVSGNAVDSMLTTYTVQPYGIWVFSTTTGVVIENNIVSNIQNTNASGYGARGIHISTGVASTNITIKNNFVWNVNATSDAATTYWGIGIGIEGATTGVNVWHNSVHLYGTLAGYNAATIHAAFAVITSTAASLDVRDNIFVNSFDNTSTTTDKSYAINSQAPNTAFTDIDYNDYFVSGDPGILGFLGADQMTLPAWQTATGDDANSLNVDPNFVANNDLHINTAYNTVGDKGVFIPSVTTDIDGDTRSVTTPDIGADEYIFVPPSVIDPTNVSATAISASQIDVAFTPNANNNNVVIVFNLTGIFTPPVGPPPAPGDPFAGGTFLASTISSPYSHTGLVENTHYYYKLFSYNGTDYSPGVAADATTFTTPLAGDYTVGLSMFNQFSGLNITFEQRVRTIEVTETIVNQEAAEQIGIYEETINGTVTLQEPADETALAPVTVTRTVEQQYFVPMLNGREYDGSLYYEFTYEQRSEYKLGIRGVYATITEAVNDAVLKGVSAAVRFLLVDATYPSETLPIVFPDITGVSAVNTITVLPNTGVTTTITGSIALPIFDLNSCSYIVIDGRQNGVGTTNSLTISNTSTASSSSCVRFMNGATFNAVQFVNLIAQPSTSTTRALEFFTSATEPSGNSNNLISNCDVNSGRYCIYFSGTAANPNMNNTIANSKFYDGTFAQFYMVSNASSTTIVNNEFFNVVPQATAGSAISMSASALLGVNNIIGNKFYDLQNTSTSTLRGITGIPGAGSTLNIINNFFSFTQDNGTKTSIYAIQISGTTEHTANIHYNTFNFAGVHTGGSAGVIVSGGLIKSNTGATSVFNAKNNIGRNTRTGGTSGVVHTNFFVGTTAIVGTLDINYNAWWASGDPGSFCAGWGGTVYNDLTLYKAAATPHEQQTIFKDVNFVSGVDLHLAGLSIGDADLAGLPLAGITDDIDGDVRDLIYPYRGADESAVKFLPISGPSNLVAIPDTLTAELSWQDNSNNEGGFIIQRKDGDSTSVNPFTNIDTVATNVIYYLNTGLNPNTTYTWRVFAINALGTSGYSNMATATTFIPVELTAFTAELSGREILVNWATATELNNRGFDIERKMDGEWEKIGFKEGRGTTTTESSYSFIDKFTYESFVGTITYRLKQMDFNGTYAYSPEVEVNVDFTPKEYTLYQNYPNPFNPITTIKYSLPFESNVRISVYNILGEMLEVVVDETKQVGFHDYNWNASNLASGIYIYTIEAKSVAGDKNYSSVKKMILMK